MQGGERFNSISNYLKKEFNGKTVKLCIDAGFTCPNRDGTLSYGGCKFCSESGSGDTATKYKKGMISKSIDSEIKKLSEKWKDTNYIVYFQAYTNTYGPVSELKEKYYEAINDPRIKGIAIATRPDCLNSKILDLLSEINDKTFLWVELGLQTSNDKTRSEMNVGYNLKDYDLAVSELLDRNIKIVTHIILGLPGEVKNDMINTVKHATSVPIFGIKLHLMNLVKDSPLYKEKPNYISFKNIDEYVNLIVELLEIIPPEITIHRLTADVPRKTLVSPEWSYKKRTILNKINLELKNKNTFQGKKCIIK